MSIKKIGIFLGFGPGQPLQNQGIGRLLGFIIKGILASEDKQIIIAIPGWYKYTIQDLIQDQEIDSSHIEFITTPTTPIWAKVVRKLLSRRKIFSSGMISYSFFSRLKRLLLKIKNRLENKVQQIFFNWISIPSDKNFTLIGLGFLILTLPFIPVILLFFAFRESYNVFCQFLKRVTAHLPSALFNYSINPITLLKQFRFSYLAYHALREREIHKLIEIVNSRKDIDTWFVPSLFWPEIAGIHAKKVVAAPDVVFVEFPEYFANLKHYYELTYKAMLKTVHAADQFICYSNHVKQNHLVQPFKINPQKVSVIQHGIIDLSDHQPKLKIDPQANHHTSIQLIQYYQQSHLIKDKYLGTYDFAHAKFIFYSSQLRPYKNFLNLIKACEILIRERFVNIKLITTADLTRDKEIYNYLLKNKLHRDIISLPHVPTKVLAALNELAICAVNPSLFEGGFPFTFAEAYSMQTPSVMSNIPVVLDVIQDARLQEVMLFDPYDLNDMVNKLHWGITHRNELLLLQKPIYEQLQERSWEMVANDYINLLSQPMLNSA